MCALKYTTSSKSSLCLLLQNKKNKELKNLLEAFSRQSYIFHWGPEVEKYSK